MSQKQYSDTAQIKCVDNNKVMQVDILSFAPQKSLAVSVQKSLKLHMKYNDRTNVYEGNMAGLTFVSSGPTGKKYS